MSKFFDVTTMTAQEVFDASAKHILAQGRPSIEPDSGLCLYRCDDGRMCAAGIFISDDVYRAEYHEEQSWGHLVSLYPAEFPYQHHDLIMALQEAHDWSGGQSGGGGSNAETFIRLYKDMMRTVALDNNLSAAVLGD